MIKNEIILALLPYSNHKSDCEALGVMWHKGPCTCGFGELVEKLRALGIDIINGAIPCDDPQPRLAVEHDPMWLPRPELAGLIAGRNDFLVLEKQLRDGEREDEKGPHR